MKVTTLNGRRFVIINVPKYRIKWAGKTRSKFQSGVKAFLKPYWQNDICIEEFRIPGCLLRCDIINLTQKIVVEISGRQHQEHVKHFHGESRIGFRDQIKRDCMKMDWAIANHFKFVEIFEEDLPLTEAFFKDKYDIIL